MISEATPYHEGSRVYYHFFGILLEVGIWVSFWPSFHFFQSWQMSLHPTKAHFARCQGPFLIFLDKRDAFLFLNTIEPKNFGHLDHHNDIPGQCRDIFQWSHGFHSLISWAVIRGLPLTNLPIIFWVCGELNLGLPQLHPGPGKLSSCENISKGTAHFSTPFLSLRIYPYSEWPTFYKATTVTIFILHVVLSCKSKVKWESSMHEFNRHNIPY